MLEIIAMVGIVFVLIMLLLPAVNRMLTEAGTAGCVQNLRQIHTLLTSYAADHQGFMPVAQNEQEDSVTWVGILQDKGYAPKVLKTTSPSKSPFFCPGSKVRDEQNRASHIYANYGINSRIAGRVRTNASRSVVGLPFAAIVNPSKKILVLDSGMWMCTSALETTPAGPYNYLPGLKANSQTSWEKRYENDAIQGRHNGKLNILMADGHVESSMARDFVGGNAWEGTEN